MRYKEKCLHQYLSANKKVPGQLDLFLLLVHCILHSFQSIQSDSVLSIYYWTWSHASLSKSLSLSCRKVRYPFFHSYRRHEEGLKIAQLAKGRNRRKAFFIGQGRTNNLDWTEWPYSLGCKEHGDYLYGYYCYRRRLILCYIPDSKSNSNCKGTGWVQLPLFGKH